MTEHSQFCLLPLYLLYGSPQHWFLLYTSFVDYRTWFIISLKIVEVFPIWWHLTLWGKIIHWCSKKANENVRCIIYICEVIFLCWICWKNRDENVWSVFIFWNRHSDSWFWRLWVWNQGISKVGFFWGP